MYCRFSLLTEKPKLGPCTWVIATRYPIPKMQITSWWEMKTNLCRLHWTLPQTGQIFFTSFRSSVSTRTYH